MHSLSRLSFSHKLRRSELIQASRLVTDTVEAWRDRLFEVFYHESEEEG